MLTAAQRDELLVRLDERTLAMHVALFGNGEKGSSLREQVATLETDVSGLQSSRRWGLAKDLLLTTAAALGLRTALGLS